MNLVELVKGQLGNQVVGQISHLIGEDTSKTEAAIHGAIPTLITDISAKAQNPEGMIGLSSILGKLNDNAVASIPGLLASGKAESLATQGSSMLANLLGKDQLSSLTSSLASSNAISETASQKLLGVLGPITIGTIKKNLLGAGGISSDNIAKLLLSQSDPADLAQAPKPQAPLHVPPKSLAKAPYEDIEVVEISEPLPSNPIQDGMIQASQRATEVRATVNDGASEAANALGSRTEQMSEQISNEADRFLDTGAELKQDIEARAEQLSPTIQDHAKHAPSHVQPLGQEEFETVHDMGTRAKNKVNDGPDGFTENRDEFQEFASQSFGQANEAGQDALDAGQTFLEATANKIGDAAASIPNESKEVAQKTGSLGSGLTRFLLPVLIVAIVIFLILNLLR